MIVVPVEKHVAYHTLFGNRTPMEVRILLKTGMRLYTIEQERAWQLLFGNRSHVDALSILEASWF